MISMTLFLEIFSVLCLFGAAMGVLIRKSVFPSLSLALLGSLFAAAVSAGVWLDFLSLSTQAFVIPLNIWQGLNASLPPIQFNFGLDSLSAFFVFLVSAFSALVAIYSFRALDAEHYRPYRHWISAAFNVFIWTTILVIVARDGFTLLLALELMTLSFGYLVLYKHYRATDTPEKFDEDHQYRYRIAPQVYLMISHTSTAFLLLAVLLLSIHASSTTFQAWTQQRTSWQGAVPALVFLLTLIGLGIRAGLTPAHIWVSLVHPSSPTTTHALSLGIAIKVAIYLMYRFFFEFLAPQEWWGYVLLAVAVVTSFVNVWYAISSHDLKEALAYHSIENIGIICAGIGLGLIFWERLPVLAWLGLLASLYHLLNHAVFKGLLYLATGAIDNLTHQNVEIDRLGGLIHRYRFTSSMFLVGSFAIAGFPPLNGFISEWLTLKTGLDGLAHLDNASPLPFVAVLLSLFLLVASFALTAFCFYKMAGVALLGLPRLPESERQDWEAEDVPLSMKGVMGLMAALTLLLGVLPAWVAPQLLKALQPLGATDTAIPWSLALLMPGSIESAQPELPALVVLLLIALFLPALLIFALRWVFPVPVRRVRPPWNCGEPLANPPFHQFSSGGLSYSLRKLFSFFNPSVKEDTKEDTKKRNTKEDTRDAQEYLPARLHLSRSEIFPQEVVEIFRLLYNRITRRLLKFSDEFALWLQSGDIRRYMSYVFVINLLVVIVYWLTSMLLK